MREIDDETLLIAVGQGSTQALEELYRRYAGRLLELGMRMLGDRGEAEDVLHDVFVGIWQRAGAFDPDRGSARTWLYLRMRSRTLDRLRSAGRARSQPLPDRFDMPGDAPSPSDVLDHQRAHDVLHHLPSEQQQVVELCYLRGLTSREAAERLSVPQGTVKSRLRLALAWLQRRFASEGSA